MYVATLILQNFRGFRSTQLDRVADVAIVLAGPNGCGKTAALDAVASLLSVIPLALTGQKRSWFGGGDTSNIRAGAEFAEWGIRLVGEGEPVEFGLTAHHDPPRDHERKSKGGGSFTFLEDAARSLRANGRAAVDLPLVTYLHSSSTRRSPRWPKLPQLVGRLAAYAGAFDMEADHFEDFERWFEQEENLENEARIRKRSLKHELPTLRAVRTALRTFLQALQAAAIGDLRVVRSHKDGPLSEVTGRLTVEKGGAALFIDQLSDGERRLVLLVGDIARRMAILNPHAKHPTRGPGIALVDEVELHLHPAWQRRVMPALQKAFPGLQFIVTTHSPQVLASVPSESVVLIDDFKFLPGHPRTRGRDSNTLLKDVFGVPERPQDVVDKLDALYDALEDHPDRAKTLYAALSEELEHDDPELARIEALLALVSDA